jgi:hypothetical protein
MDITWFRGDTLPLTIRVKDSTGVAVDITGSTFFLTVKQNKEDLDANAVISENQATHDDPTNGVTSFTISNTAMTLSPGEYFYDIQVKTALGRVRTILSGKFIIVTDITRRTA